MLNALVNCHLVGDLLYEIYFLMWESLVVAPVKYQNAPYPVAADKRQDTSGIVTTENRLPRSEYFIDFVAVPFMPVIVSFAHA